MKTIDIIRCKIKIRKVYFPKDLSTHTPGDWASFSADVTEEKSGDIKTKHGFLMLCGATPSLEYGQEYYLAAKYAPSDKYGDQYKILYMNKVIDFSNPVEQRQFLEHILTENQINVLYEQFDNPFEIIKNRDVSTLSSIKGIGTKKAEAIIDKYYNNLDNAYAFIQLDDYGLTDYMIFKLIEKYGSAETLVYKIRENPYILIDEVDGIGWKKADSIAVNSGIEAQSVIRVKAYIKYYLIKESSSGNSWTDVNVVVTKCIEELKLTDPDVLRQALYELNDEHQLWWDNEKTMLALTFIRELELKIAKEMHRLQAAPAKTIKADIEKAIKEVENEKQIEYTDEQKAAIKLVVSNNVSILTGYGGTGKSTTVAGVLNILKSFNFAQTALSGRAAARLSEITDEEGFTIHRLLNYNPVSKNFYYNQDNPLPYDIIILDEVSMVGAALFYDLVKAIKTGAKLIMLGDEGQLESIGMCNIFKDMLTSGVIPVARLTKIHRQAAKSAIITESIKVRHGKQLTSYGWVGQETRGELKDLELNIYGDSVLSQEYVISKFKEVYEQTKDIDKIQIVLPQKHRGEICTEKINSIIQQLLLPTSSAEVEVHAMAEKGAISYVLRVNDRVIVNKNNYDTLTIEGKACPIYNGNKGVIKSIDLKKKKMIINFEQWGEIIIPYKLWNTIELAYALTCHKLQGSEAPYVIIGLDFSAKTLLTREWLYTAITRAKMKCYICAESKALHYTIANSNVPYKRTFLQRFLVDQFKSEG